MSNLKSQSFPLPEPKKEMTTDGEDPQGRKPSVVVEKRAKLVQTRSELERFQTLQ